MIGVHSADILTSKQTFERTHKYYKTLLNDLIKAKEEGLSLQETKDKLSVDTSYAFVLRDFTMPADRNVTHQKNIEKIWPLLQ
jgi:hypothetical protein